METTEIWKDVPEYEGIYKVSNLGNIYTYYQDRILKNHIQSNGYYFVHLFKNKKHKSQRIHVLVAMAFLNHIPNKQNLVVDHIDNDKTNNKLSNLQILSQRENTNKSMKIGASGYRGVVYTSINNKWQVRIRVLNKKIHIKYFTDIEKASDCYNEITKIVDEAKHNKLTLDEIKELIKIYKSKIKEHGKITNN
jgi:hypothetical protein